MKNKDFEKMKNQTPAELTAGVVSAREKLWQAGREISAGKTKNVRVVRAIRVEIARLLTLLNAKKVTK